jgi:hypothetical protein
MMANTITFKKLEEMITLLYSYNKGAKIMGLYVRTHPKANLPDFTKEQFMNVIVNFNWKNTMNRMLKKNDFEFSKKPVWWERVGKTPIVRHKVTGDLYLRTRPKYIGPPSYFLNGKQILDIPELEAIKPDLPLNAPGVIHEKENAFKLIKISSIRAVTVDHATYVTQA